MSAAAERVLLRHPETVLEARALLDGFLVHNGVTGREALDLSLALTEACANAVLHADGAATYTIEIALDGGRCTIVVRDDGPGFAPLPMTMPEPQAVGGRGLAIMRALVDRAEIRTRPGAGTTVVLTKHVHPLRDRAQQQSQATSR
jgi:serine/threonine-protein kinase RsbW